MKRGPYNRPSIENVLFLHRLVEEYGAERGFSKSLVEACLNFPFTETYRHTPYKDVFAKAAALLYAVISFHPFVDGNKRTALLVTSLFLALNGYQFRYPSDTVEKTIAIAEGKIDIPAIANWLKSNCVKRRKNTIFYIEINEDYLRPQIDLKHLLKRKSDKNKI